MDMDVDTAAFYRIRTGLTSAVGGIADAAFSMSRAVTSAGCGMEGEQYNLAQSEIAHAESIVTASVDNIHSLLSYLNELEDCVSEYVNCTY